MSVIAQVKSLVHQATSIAAPQSELVAEYAISAFHQFLYDHVPHDEELHITYKLTRMYHYDRQQFPLPQTFTINIQRHEEAGLWTIITGQASVFEPYPRNHVRTEKTRPLSTSRYADIHSIDDQPEVWVASILGPQAQPNESIIALGLGNQIKQSALAANMTQPIVEHPSSGGALFCGRQRGCSRSTWRAYAPCGRTPRTCPRSKLNDILAIIPRHVCA